jgi:hypothetical protein
MASLKTIPGNCADFAASAGLFSNHLEKALRASLSNTSPFDVTASRATASFLRAERHGNSGKNPKSSVKTHG